MGVTAFAPDAKLDETALKYLSFRATHKLVYRFHYITASPTRLNDELLSVGLYTKLEPNTALLHELHVFYSWC